ncbi:MAG: hypothetical protein IRZ08_19880 [Frankia sp.]|nr:hypothetical protein [Frankia sp.]
MPPASPPPPAPLPPQGPPPAPAATRPPDADGGGGGADDPGGTGNDRPATHPDDDQQAAGQYLDPAGSALVAHALAQRRVGVLLVRLGGYAAGVFDAGRLVASRTGSRQVHGRSAAGGWSQQRFARRREGQARAALAAAADTAAAVLVPASPGLDAVVAGGDRRAVTQVLADPRLAPLRPLLVAEPFLTVPDPRRRVLEQAPRLFRAVRIRVSEPGQPPGTRDDGADEPV